MAISKAGGFTENDLQKTMRSMLATAAVILPLAITGAAATVLAAFHSRLAAMLTALSVLLALGFVTVVLLAILEHILWMRVEMNGTNEASVTKTETKIRIARK